MRDYQREVLFGPEPEIDPIATEREIERLQQERVARLRRPVFDPEPEEDEEEDYEPKPYSGEWTNKPKYKIYRDKSGSVLGYQEDGIELDSEGNPRKTILYDHDEDSWLPSRNETDDEPDYKTRTDREKVSDWLRVGSIPSMEEFPGWDRVGGAAREIAGEKLDVAREKLGDVADYVGDTIEHYDDRRLLSYGVSPDLLSTYRAWQEKYDNARETGDDEGAKHAYREMRAVKYQIDSQVEHYKLLERERRAKAAELRRREQGASRGYPTGGRSSGRSTRSGISDRGLENHLMPKKSPARVGLLPDRQLAPGVGVGVHRNKNVDLSVRSNPNAVSPVVRRSGAVAGGVPPLSGGVSPLVQRRTQYTPTLHRPRYEPPRIGQSFPAPRPRQAPVPEPRSNVTGRFQFPTVSAAGFFGGVIGGNVVSNIEKNFALPNRHGTTTPRRFNRRFDTSPTRSTSKIVENINSLVGNSHERRRGARVTVGAPIINIPTIDPTRFAAVTPRKMKKGERRGTATKKRNIDANLADLVGITIRRVRR